MKKEYIILSLILILFVICSTLFIVYASNEKNTKLPPEIRKASLEKASSSAYDEKNLEFTQKLLDIFEMDTSTEENRIKQETQYKALKDEMYEYMENKTQEFDTTADMSIDELEKKLNDLEVAYEILEKGATNKNKLQYYTNTIAEIQSLHNELDKVKTSSISTKSSSYSTSVKDIENKYKNLRTKLGLDE